MFNAKVTSKKHIDYNKLSKVNDLFLPAAGVLVQSAAKRNIRANRSIDSGRLRSSISYYTSNNNKSGVEKPARSSDQVSKPKSIDSVSVGTGVEYAPYVEYGTVRMPGGKPYLRPALDNNRKNLINLFRTYLRKLW